MNGFITVIMTRFQRFHVRKKLYHNKIIMNSTINHKIYQNQHKIFVLLLHLQGKNQQSGFIIMDTRTQGRPQSFVHNPRSTIFIQNPRYTRDVIQELPTVILTALGLPQIVQNRMNHTQGCKQIGHHTLAVQPRNVIYDLILIIWKSLDSSSTQSYVAILIGLRSDYNLVQVKTFQLVSRFALI